MKKIYIKSLIFTGFLTGVSLVASAQTTSQKIGTNPTIKTPSALLELEATNKGTLLTRVALTSLTDAVTIATPADALTVFNTATTTTGTNDVTPGYYYWKEDTVTPANSKWVRLLDDPGAFAIEPWNVRLTTNKATANTDAIYQTGSVAVGTQNGIGVFHIDAAKNNPATGTPTSTNVLDDIIATPGGRIGFGYNPSDVVIGANQFDDKVTFQANGDLDVNYSLATTSNSQAIVHRNIISSGTIGARTARSNGTSIAAFEGHTTTSDGTYGAGSLITQQRAGIVLRTGKENAFGGEIWFGTSGASAGDGGKTLATAAGNSYRAVIDQRGNWALGSDPNVDPWYRKPTERIDLILGGVRIGALGYGTLAAWRTPEIAERPNYISTDGNDRAVVADANGVLKVRASAIAIKTADYTMLTTDETILVDATSGIIKITLPDASKVKGKKYIVKKIGANNGPGNSVRVVATAGTIEGIPAATGVAGGELAWVVWEFQSDGTNWYIISRIN